MPAGRAGWLSGVRWAHGAARGQSPATTGLAASPLAFPLDLDGAEDHGVAGFDAFPAEDPGDAPALQAAQDFVVRADRLGVHHLDEADRPVAFDDELAIFLVDGEALLAGRAQDRDLVARLLD